MARKRMIDPSFWDDLNVAKLSIPARLCFIGMVSNADDEGRIEADPRYIKRAVFGFDDDLSSADIAGYLAEIETSCPGVVFYQVDGRALAAFTNWKRYQYIQKPQTSRLPAPPELSDTVPATDEYDTDTIPLQPNRIEENRIEGEGNARARPSPDPTVEARLFAIFENPKQIKKFIAAAAVKRGAFTLSDVDVCERWLEAQSFRGKIGALNNILEAGQLPKMAAAINEPSMTEEEKMAKYVAQFNGRKVHPSDYRGR